MSSTNHSTFTQVWCHATQAIISLPICTAIFRTVPPNHPSSLLDFLQYVKRDEKWTSTSSRYCLINLMLFLLQRNMLRWSSTILTGGKTESLKRGHSSTLGEGTDPYKRSINIPQGTQKKTKPPCQALPAWGPAAGQPLQPASALHGPATLVLQYI